MPDGRHVQTNYTSGEFAPNLFSREDITFFYSSARLLENVVVLPEAGARRRDGWRYRARLRGVMSAISTGGATITAPNGGTAGNATDNDRSTVVLTTGAIGTEDDYVLLHIDFGTTLANAVAAVDAKDLFFTSLPASLDNEDVELQSSSDNAAWTIRDTLEVGNVAYNRRFAVAPASNMGTDRYWRIVRAGTTDMTTAELSISEIDFWTEDTATKEDEFAELRISADINNEYGVLITGNSADVYELSAGAWVASLFMPYTSAQLRDISVNARLSTAILYHEDVAPQIIQNLSGAAEWRSDDVTFTTTADFSFDDATTGGVNEKQYATFTGMSVSDTVYFEFNGEISALSAWSATPATNITAFTAAIEGLTGITDVTVTQDGSSDNYFIEFVGDDGVQPWALLVVSLGIGTGTAVVSRKQAGLKHFAALWSAARGYPRCGTFYGGRHWMGGFKGVPDLLIGSRAGALFDFKLDADPVSTSPIIARADTDEQVTILNIHAGRNLQIFTSALELYVPDEPITPANIALPIATRVGSQEETRPVDVQGATLFVGRDGQSLREFLFSDAEQSYTAQSISFLSGHRIAAPRSMAFKRKTGDNQPDLLLIANTGTDEDGETVLATQVTIDRALQISGFTRIKVEGGRTAAATPKAFITSQAGEAFAVVERVVGDPSTAVARFYLEQLDENYLTDCSVKIANPDIDDFVASEAQTVFTYTFTSPVSTSDVAVWYRTDATVDWARVASADYTVDLSAQTITLTVLSLTEGELIRVNLRADTIPTLTDGAHLDQDTVFVSGDGLPLGTYDVADDEIVMSSGRFDFEAEIGFAQLPTIRLHTYKAAGQVSPTMKRQRIHSVLMDWRKTLTATIGFEGRASHELPMTYEKSVVAVSLIVKDRAGANITDRAGNTINVRESERRVEAVLADTLVTEAFREKGIGAWEVEPHLELSQTEPAAWHLRSLTYDVRF